MIAELTNHLWQSTLFAIGAGLLAVAFRKNRAQTRWEAAFSGSFETLIVNGKLLPAHSEVEHLRRPISWVRVPVCGGCSMQVKTPQ